MAQSIYSGEKFNYTTSGAVTNGALLILGNTPAVALSAATGSGKSIAVATEGVFTLTRKASAGNVGLGNRAYYIATGGVNKITSVAGAGTMVGCYAEATTTASTTCKVKLLGGPIPLETQA